MSVVPLIPGVTVVNSAAAFDRGGSAILIQNLDPEQLVNPKQSNVSYDLRVGGEYFDHRNLDRRALAKGEQLRLLPGMAIIIETEEFVHFPTWAFGSIVPKVSLLKEGISNTTSKVDPGYNGTLLITVFNLGKKTVTLRRGDPFCSIYLLRIDGGVIPYDGPPKRLSGKPAGLFSALLNRIEGHLGLLIGVQTLINIVLIILTGCLLYQQLRQH